MTPGNHAAYFQDEVYREMFRLEAGCPSADLRLAVALLRAWLALERNPPGSRSRQWLRVVCPVCLRMIEAAPPACQDENRELSARRS
jgi:hypothetical protein